MLNQLSHCEYCQQQISCRNIYVAMKILEEDIRCVQRPELNLRIQQLKEDMSAAGYDYGASHGPCTLTQAGQEVLSFLSRAEALLAESREVLKLLNA